jgi:phosphoglycolate phosphatase-like HAD superfamily hydrolase
MDIHFVFDCDGTLVDTSSGRYELFPGIKEILLSLSRKGILTVWTARDQLSAVRILKENQVYNLFHSLYTSDDEFPKPLPRGLYELTHGAPRHLVYVIGDTAMDMMGAKNYGARAIGAIWNKSSSETLLVEAGADFIASTPEEGLAWLESQISIK